MVDFAVEDRLLWPRVGVELLAAVRVMARDRGATEAVVVTARLDGPKRAALTAAGLVPASEWWVGRLDALSYPCRTASTSRSRAAPAGPSMLSSTTTVASADGMRWTSVVTPGSPPPWPNRPSP